MNTEIWKDIPGWEGLYQVSNLGKVKGLERIDSIGRSKKETILKFGIDKYLYKYVVFCRNSITRKYKIHRLVASAFLGLDINDKNLCVCHKDDTPGNNILKNLFVGTIHDNMQDMKNKGRQGSLGKTGELCWNSKKVDQFTREGIYIQTFPSMISASKFVGANSKHISECCLGKLKTAYGFKWKYSIT